MKQNIKISRYTEAQENAPGAKCPDGTFPWAASVEPEDREWVLFVPKDPLEPPALWVKIGKTLDGEEDVYGVAWGEQHQAYLAERRAGVVDPVRA